MLPLCKERRDMGEAALDHLRHTTNSTEILLGTIQFRSRFSHPEQYDLKLNDTNKI
jgi:hypothetical protein